MAKTTNLHDETIAVMASVSKALARGLTPAEIDRMLNPDFAAHEELLDASDVKRDYKLGPVQLRYMRNTGRIKPVKFGPRTFRYRRSDLDAVASRMDAGCTDANQN